MLDWVWHRQGVVEEGREEPLVGSLGFRWESQGGLSLERRRLGLDRREKWNRGTCEVKDASIRDGNAKTRRGGGRTFGIHYTES